MYTLSMLYWAGKLCSASLGRGARGLAWPKLFRARRGGGPSISARDSISKQQTLISRHHRLMAVYTYALGKMSEPGPLPEEAKSFKRPRWKNVRQFRGRHRPITNALIESHIKAKLGELRAAYMQIEQSIPDADAVQSFRGWLRDTEDSLSRFSATFTVMALVRRIAAALWPLVISVVVIGAVWNAVSDLFGKISKSDFLVIIVAYALLIFVAVLFGLGWAARRKRRFFLVPVSISNVWASSFSGTPVEATTAKNVYVIENELFTCIGKSKRLELPLDAIGFGCAWLFFAATCVIVIIGEPGGPELFGVLFIGFISATSLAWGVITIISGYRLKLR
jgi:hypothetical protein